eukprot:scaffold192793_cov40-Cyclotella_meneghiniana.AAC.2
MPSHVWLRPLGTMFGVTLPSTKTACTPSIKTVLHLQKQDPPVKQQSAIPTILIKELTNLQETELQKSVAQSVGAFFFLMLSCEYLKVSKQRSDASTSYG